MASFMLRVSKQPRFSAAIRRIGVGIAAVALAMSPLVGAARADEPEASAFQLADPSSELYYTLAATAGAELDIDREAEIDGDLHSNGVAKIARDARVIGDVSATTEIDNRGTVTGSELEGVAPKALPTIDAELFRSLADRVIEGDLTLEDTVLTDVLFVDGNVDLKGSLSGIGTLFATGDIRIHRKDGNVLDADSRLSLISLGGIRVGHQRQIRAALRSAGRLELDQESRVEGVLIGDGEIRIQRGATLTFFNFDAVKPELAITAPFFPLIRLGESVEIAAEYSDRDSGLDLASLAVTIDSNDVTAGCTVDATGVSCQASGVAEGVHTLVVEIADLAGNVATASLDFEVTSVDDQDGPRAFLVSPLGPGVPAAIPFELMIKYSDDGVGVFPASLQVTLDGEDVSADCAVGPINARCPLPALAEGDHTVSATVSDRLGNPGTVSRILSAAAIDDDVPPQIEITRPDGQPLAAGAAPGVVVGYSDAESGIDLGSLAVVLDGNELSDCAASSILTFCDTPALAAGAHTVTATVRDLLGNPATASVTFAVENTANLPSITFLSPTAATTTDPGPPIVVAYAATARPLDLASFDLFADGVSILNGCTVDAAEAVCGSPVFRPGAHTFEARIADDSGLESSVAVTFTVEPDLGPPVVTILTPANDSGSAVPQVEVTGTVSDDVGVVRLLLNGEEIALDGETFSVIADLVLGFNALRIEAIDEAGFVGAAAAVVRYPADVTAPDLAITSLESGSFITTATPPIALSYRDDSDLDLDSLTVFANGQPLLIDCQLEATAGTCVLAEDLAAGDVELTATLADIFGNTATATALVTVDTEGVEITLDAPSTGPVTAAATVEVRGTVNPASATVEVNGVAANVAGGAFSATVPLAEGRNMLVALAIKANGNTGTAAVDITHDVQAPIVRVESPRDGLVAVSNRLPVTGVVNDIVSGGLPATVTINGEPAAVAAGGFMIPEIELVPGPNVIEAVATDAVGNEGRHSVTVLFRPPAGARIEAVAGNGQSAEVNEVVAEPLVVRVVDALGQGLAGRRVRFDVSRNNGLLRLENGGVSERSFSVLTDADGHAQVLWTLGDTAGEGNQRLRVTAQGVAGEVEFCATALPGAPRRVMMVGGDNQRGAVGRPLSSPLEALVIDANGNPLPGVDLTFEVTAGGGQLAGGDSVILTTDADGVARAALTLGSTPGINNNAVRAVVQTPGSPSPGATYVSSALAPGPPAATALSGIVLDNTQTPIPNVLVEIAGSSLSTRTAEDGSFTLLAVPAGRLALHFDPSESPRPELFPPLDLEVVTIAGRNNRLGQPVELPALDAANARVVGGSEDVTLTMEGVEGLTLTVFADSVTFPDGSSTGILSISQVHLDKVPMSPPNGSLFMPPAWTIQPAGVVFDPPARITIPNDGLPPGRVIDIFQFDHPTNTFVDVGPGAVSNDGFVITSLPGFGITRSGWGGCGLPPPPDTCVDACEECQACNDDRCEPDDSVTPSSPPPFTEEAGGEITLVEGKMKRAIRKIPFIGSFEATVGGSASVTISPSCCDGEKLLTGMQEYTGSLSATLAVKAQLAPLPTFDIDESTTIFGVRVGIEFALNLGPYIELSASPVASISGMKDRCTGDDCLVASVCSSFAVQIGAEAAVDFEIEIGEDTDIIDDDDSIDSDDGEFIANASVFGEGSGSVGFVWDRCSNVDSSQACIQPITGNLELKAGSFFSLTLSIELTEGSGECCG